jgi:hypothetical protein
MPLVHTCSIENCQTLTMGTYCLEHERRASDPPRRLAVVGRKALLPTVALLSAALGAALRSRFPG